MKLHDLRPADGSRQPRTRVGRGIAAGKGKTAGRGTKGQKARAGGGIPAWFEGGQTPLHMRIPKLRGFKNRFKIEYEVVNIGAIGALADAGAFEMEGGKASSKAPVTINQDILRAVGLVRTLNKPMKILGAGELSVPLFVVADAFTASARAKIEAAGGSVNVLEIPKTPLAALGVTPEADAEPTATAPTQAPAKAKADKADQAAKAAKPAKASAKASSEDEVASTASASADSASADSASADSAEAVADTPDTPDADAPATATATDTDQTDADAAAPADEAELPTGDDA
jgi:large subunit ribosomal protein L15